MVAIGVARLVGQEMQQTGLIIVATTDELSIEIGQHKDFAQVVAKVGALRLVEPIALVVGQPKPLLVEFEFLAEEELVPVELASANFQLVVEKAKELKVQQLKLVEESILRQVATQELVKHLRLEVDHHPKPEECFHQLPFSTLVSCNDPDTLDQHTQLLPIPQQTDTSNHKHWHPNLLSPIRPYQPPFRQHPQYHQKCQIFVEFVPRPSGFEAANIGVSTIVERPSSIVAAIEELGSTGVAQVVIVGTIVMAKVVEELVKQHTVVAKLKVPISTASEELIVAVEAFTATRIVVANLPLVGCLDIIS